MRSVTMLFSFYVVVSHEHGQVHTMQYTILRALRWALLLCTVSENKPSNDNEYGNFASISVRTSDTYKCIQYRINL